MLFQKEKFEDTKGVIGSRTSQKGKTIQSGENSGAPGGKTVPAPLLTDVVLLVNDTNVIQQGNRVVHQ